jgi:hypothetical protein
MNVEILGKSIPMSFAEGQMIDDDKRERLERGVEAMAALINSIAWPDDYANAYRSMKGVVFFDQPVLVNGYMMDRPCCDEDDAVFYWEIQEFLSYDDADVHASTFFHDCWHVIQFRAAGDMFARDEDERLEREVDAVRHQIGVAHMLGCSEHEIGHLVKFSQDHATILARLDEGVGAFAAHPPGAFATANA